MLIDISEILNNQKQILNIDLELHFEKDELSNTEIRSIDPVKVEGSIKKESANNVVLLLNIKGKMILPCSISLKDVDFNFEIDYQNEEPLNFEGNTIDIKPIVWENIVTEIPLKVISPDAKIEIQEGNGWKVITEEEKELENEFSKLKDLFKEEEEI